MLGKSSGMKFLYVANTVLVFAVVSLALSYSFLSGAYVLFEGQEQSGTLATVAVVASLAAVLFLCVVRRLKNLQVLSREALLSLLFP